jgi:hypothetical protein
MVVRCSALLRAVTNRPLMKALVNGDDNNSGVQYDKDYHEYNTTDEH